MNSKDLQNLQEAYLEVYGEEYVEQLDEISNRVVDNTLNARIAATADASDRAYKHRNPEAMRAAEKASAKEARMKSAVARRRKRKQNVGEQVDIYDIILSHLLDEGYADTEQSAEIIMVNMSEEWRGSICEEFLDEMRKEDKVKGKKKTPLHITTTTRSAQRTPEGSERKWEVRNMERKLVNPVVSMKRGFGRVPIHPHGEGGIHRGKKKKEQINAPEPGLNVYQRKRELAVRKGATRYGMIGDRAAAQEAERRKKNFKTASQKWSSEGK